MNRLHTTLFIALSTLVIGLAATPALAAEEAVNDRCPISGEPIDGKTTYTYDDHTVGFCCPGCVNAFKRWDDERKSAFITTAIKGSSGGSTTKPDDAAEKNRDDAAAKGDPYLLPTCPVSGKKLGSMGDPVVRVYDGREVRFCCAGCVGPFEKDKAKHFKQIDEKIIERQMERYPLETCPVSGMKLGSMGEPINVVHSNRLVRFCCSGCLPKFNADPAKYVGKLDEAVKKQQRADYPLDTCVISGMKLGSMGDPYEIVVGNRLVRFCCAGCEPKFRKDPHDSLAKIDKARQDASTN
jgi:YHS domain-containing protein